MFVILIFITFFSDYKSNVILKEMKSGSHLKKIFIDLSERACCAQAGGVASKGKSKSPVEQGAQWSWAGSPGSIPGLWY